MKSFRKLILPFLFIGLVIILNFFLIPELDVPEKQSIGFERAAKILMIFGICWGLIISLRGIKQIFLKNFDINKEDNLRYRKFFTQYNILEKLLSFLIVFLGVAFSLMLFDGVRQLGVSLFASAGITGIILGFAAQKLIGTALAGLQLAFTQPIRLDDVLVVEGEWGRVEEINLTYVVIKIWDKRRLILPSTYFIEKPFENWTRTNAEIMGTVFLHTHYNVPFEAMRAELDKILAATPLWDGQVKELVVTQAKESAVESRILVSAKDSGTAWDLRVHVREKMIKFLQENYPESLPIRRIELIDRHSSNPDYS
ncbi:MAG: mechanosensitive ion channel family protein [Bacteroidia bacterium]|nr:mechanosensitive ion channel family protein [Bacteroidia bacterium]